MRDVTEQLNLILSQYEHFDAEHNKDDKEQGNCPKCKSRIFYLEILTLYNVCSVHRGDIMSTSGDVQYIGVFNRNLKAFINLLPHMHHDIPPMY